MSVARRTLLRQPLFSQHVPQQRSLQVTTTVLRSIRASRSPFQRRFQSTVADGSIPGAAPPPPQRSIFNRLFRTAVGASFFALLGVYVGYAFLPDKVPLLSLISSRPTDEETNSLYTPPDAATAQINTHVLQHALSRSLRSNPDFIESRPHMKIPEALRKANLTGGTLAGPGRIAVPPVQFVEKDGKSLVSIVYLGEQLCGHPGIVHGGLLATLLDEGLARCCFPALPNGIGVTANLKIDYRKPVKAEGYYVLRARTQKVDGRKAWVKGWIEKLGDDAEEVGEKGAKGEVSGEEPAKGEMKEAEKLVEAEALFIEPRNAGVIKKIYKP